jgi:hypothetical protein
LVPLAAFGAVTIPLKVAFAEDMFAEAVMLVAVMLVADAFPVTVIFPLTVKLPEVPDRPFIKLVPSQ